MQTINYVNSEQFELDWKHAKSEVQRIIKPQLTTITGPLRFSATIQKKSQIAWIETREPHPAVCVLAVTLPRNVEPSASRITAWFYEDAAAPYQRFTTQFRVLFLKQYIKPPKSGIEFTLR